MTYSLSSFSSPLFPFPSPFFPSLSSCSEMMPPLPKDGEWSCTHSPVRTQAPQVCVETRLCICNRGVNSVSYLSKFSLPIAVSILLHEWEMTSIAHTCLPLRDVAGIFEVEEMLAMRRHSPTTVSPSFVPRSAHSGSPFHHPIFECFTVCKNGGDKPGTIYTTW